jgi:hypothetical protein
MLNIAGPEYDFGHVVFAVLQECEHRRRSIDDEELKEAMAGCAREKLAHIRKAYEEMEGSASYWEALEKEVLQVAVPQYTATALEMNQEERHFFGLFRQGDLGARFLFALLGLLIGSVIIALPFIPIFEDLFAFALTVVGFMYPDLKRWMYERRYAKTLNRIIADAARYQADARLHYMTTEEITKSLTPGAPSSRA